jgi:dipeptidyl aminopeptidase/acylaminoacyl peptidase
MKHHRWIILLLVGMAVFAGRVAAQTPFTIDQVLSHPFPADLIASPIGSTIAWTFNERGRRNVYVAEGPQFTTRQLTHYDTDEGQELTFLSFSDDGKYVVYVRGGDHGSNWAAEGNLQPNPASSAVEPKMRVYSVPVAGGEPTLLGEGDEPTIAPRTHQVAFLKERRIWIAPIDGAKPAAQLLFAKGESQSPAWSPDGTTLAFVSARDDHSFIGLYTSEGEPIRYVMPTTSRDTNPTWAPDGTHLAFVRQPGRAGAIPPPLEQQPQPWSIWVADATTATAREAWHSGSTIADSIPETEGGVNLHWAAADRLVFLSYQDGWPHLYSVPASGGQELLLTPGTFMVEYASLSPDRRTIVYNANSGPEPNDVDRRHVFSVPVDAATPVRMTSGQGIEWDPVITGDGRTVAYFSSDVRRPALPAVLAISGGTPKLIAQDRVPANFPSGQFVTPENVIVRAPDGVEAHCQLFKSAGGDARRPAVVFVHGGPPRQMLLGWHYMFYYANAYALNQYLASRGFIVLSVNYRLGIGYGHKFHYPTRAGARGASEYQDVLAAGQYLQARPDVDPKRVGVWGGSYGGYLTALALGRNSDVFAAGVDIHGVHYRRPPIAFEDAPRALLDGVSEDTLKEMLKVSWLSSPVSTVPGWRSPVLMIHADDDRNVEFHQTVDLVQRLRTNGVQVEELVIPDDIHDFLLFRSWKTVFQATSDYFDKVFGARPRISQ